LGIEVATSKRETSVSQWKNMIDIL